MDAEPSAAGTPCAASPPLTRVLALGVAYFAAVFAAGFVLGVVRTLALEPRVGPLMAVTLELPLMLSWAWWVCSRLLRHRAGLSPRAAVVLGGVAFGCLMVAEAALSIGLAGRSLVDHLALYGEPAHGLGLIGQLLFAAWPAVQTLRTQGRRGRGPGSGGGA